MCATVVVADSVASLDALETRRRRQRHPRREVGQAEADPAEVADELVCLGVSRVENERGNGTERTELGLAAVEAQHELVAAKALCGEVDDGQESARR